MVNPSKYSRLTESIRSKLKPCNSASNYARGLFNDVPVLDALEEAGVRLAYTWPDRIPKTPFTQLPPSSKVMPMYAKGR